MARVMELRKEIEAVSGNEKEEVIDKLIERVAKLVCNRIAKDYCMEKKMEMIKKKKCSGIGITNKNSSRKEKGGAVKRCHGPSSVEEEEEEQQLIIKKQKKKTKACNEKKNGKTTTTTKKKKQKTSTAGGESQKTKHSKIIQELDANPPPMPEEFRKCIENLGGTDISLVIHKIIFDTDLSKSHNRLSITIKKIKNKFFSDDEETNFIKSGEAKEVKLVEPCLKVSKVNLTSWLIGGSQAFVFNNQWHKIVVENADTLKTMAVFQIWSFWVRRESQKPDLGFALIKVGDVPDF
ncbi:hypothetical protein COLO4_18803 [Corchorus olitorius]|uniref:B3 domain-containing protein n=1 Tax=Corchorus olitorius TaxID=93759 RepID=A0A1R3J7W4_9ROSI|nr:hypothetical protein COLO4_18803 [Corchorus olitorius]